MTWAAAFFGSVVVVCVAALVGSWMDKVGGQSDNGGARCATTGKPEVTEEEAARPATAPKRWTG